MIRRYSTQSCPPRATSLRSFTGCAIVRVTNAYICLTTPVMSVISRHCPQELAQLSLRHADNQPFYRARARSRLRMFRLARGKARRTVSDRSSDPRRDQRRRCRRQYSARSIRSVDHRFLRPDARSGSDCGQHSARTQFFDLRRWVQILGRSGSWRSPAAKRR